MRIGIVSDVHGCTAWKKAIEKFKYVDKVVFLGDYVDSFKEEEKGLPAADNLKEILAYKNSENLKVTLLVGNHDFENYWFRMGTASGFQLNMFDTYSRIFTENADKFDMCIEFDNWVFSHAGVSSDWLQFVKTSIALRIPTFEFPNSDVIFINELFKAGQSKYFQYYKWDFSRCGNDPMQGPLWIRPSALENPAFDKQVVGHTELKESPFTIGLKDNKKLVCTDSQNHSIFYILNTENDEIETINLE